MFVDFYQNFSYDCTWSANKLYNFTKILKAQKLKNSCRPSINKIFYYFAPLGFGIVEYSDQPIIVKNWVCVCVCFCPEWTQILENEVHCPGFI